MTERNGLAWARWLLLFAGTVGCGGSGTPGGGTGGSGGGDGVIPIVERTPRSRYDCRVQRDLTFQAPRLWDEATLLAPEGATSAFMARLESTTEDPLWPAPRELLVSHLSSEGVLGTPTRVGAALASGEIVYLSAASRDGGVALVWIDGRSSAVTFAALDASGAIVVSPREILPATTVQPSYATVSLVAGADGSFALLMPWSATWDNTELRFLTLAADGTPRGAYRVVARGNLGYAPRMASTTDGYGVLWTDAANDDGRVMFAKASLDGAEIVPPRPLASSGRPNWMFGSDLALLGQGDGYLAAWTEGRWDPAQDSSGASTIIRVARLDGQGVPVAPAAPLRAPTEDIDEVEPSLVPFGDAVAVLWARGQHIYSCAGCVPDHRMDLLIVDPVDLTPLGSVVTVVPRSVPPATRSGGLFNRSVAVLGPTILTALEVRFHVHHTSATASFRCDPKPP